MEHIFIKIKEGETVTQLFQKQVKDVPLKSAIDKRMWLLKPAIDENHITTEQVEDISKRCLGDWLRKYFNEEKTNIIFDAYLATNSCDNFLKNTQQFHKYHPTIVAFVCAYKLLKEDEFGELYVKLPNIGQ